MFIKNNSFFLQPGIPGNWPTDNTFLVLASQETYLAKVVGIQIRKKIWEVLLEEKNRNWHFLVWESKR